MLLTDEEIQERLESPMNLLNRLKNATKAHSPSLPPPSAKDLIPDLDEKLDGDVKRQAEKIMRSALKELEVRIPDVQKPEKLAQIAAEMHKVLIANKDKGPENGPQFIIYAPQVIQESHFEQIVVQE
jgi:hypothetical protein